ncbi:hypothetical protein [Roseateles sp. P5_E1]
MSISAVSDRREVVAAEAAATPGPMPLAINEGILMRNGLVPVSPCRWVHLHVAIVVCAVVAALIQSICAVAPMEMQGATASTPSRDAPQRSDT